MVVSADGSTQVSVVYSRHCSDLVCSLKSKAEQCWLRDGIFLDLVEIPSAETFLIEHFIRCELCQTHEALYVWIQSYKNWAKRVTFEIEGSFLWLEDKHAQVILRAIKNTFMRLLKKKQGICNTKKNEWETHFMMSRYPTKPPPLPILRSWLCVWAGRWIQPSTVEGVGVGPGTLNHNWGDEFFHSCQAT